MNTFLKWLVASIFLSIISLIIVLNVEGWAELLGELNRNVILTGTIATFILVIISMYCLFKANSERKKNYMVLSLFVSLVPLSVFVMNGLVFTVWFIEK